MESKRRLKVSALAEGLAATSLVLSLATVASPYWGRFSNEGSPSSGGKCPVLIENSKSECSVTIARVHLRESSGETRKWGHKCWDKFFQVSFVYTIRSSLLCAVEGVAQTKASSGAGLPCVKTSQEIVALKWMPPRRSRFLFYSAPDETGAGCALYHGKKTGHVCHYRGWKSGSCVLLPLVYLITCPRGARVVGAFKKSFSSRTQFVCYCLRRPLRAFA